MDFLIVGLGNPGREHARQRHNIGFMAVDAMADHYRADNWKNKFSAEICTAKVTGFDVHFLKPQTYMNLSGDAVAQAARFFKYPVERIIVLHDELDIPFCQVRVKQGGGNGGHNGLRSIDACLGTGNYWRVRLGIDHPGEKYLVTPHVLGDFTADERDKVDDLITRVTKDFSLLLNNKANDFTRKVNVAETK